MTEIVRTILDRLTSDDSPQRERLVEIAVDYVLDLPLRALADPDEVLEALLDAVTTANLERAFDRHLRPARGRRQARWQDSGERAGDLIPGPTAARVEALLSRSQGPSAGWASGAIDPADVRALLAPALRRLGVGSIRPAGWLKDELTLQAQGISGQLPYFWHYLNSTEWLDPAARDPYGRAGGS